MLIARFSWWLVAAVMFSVGSARAQFDLNPTDTPGVTFAATPRYFVAGVDATRGWAFSTTVPISVTALGLWDVGGDGFVLPHVVGLWNSSSLLTALTIPAGTVAELAGPDGFRYISLGTPLVLPPGVYQIGAAYATGELDYIAYQAAPVGAPGFVSYLGPRRSLIPGLANPTAMSANEQGAFGPNFLFQPVPEPGSLLLVLAALSAGFVSRRWRRAKR